MTIQLTGSRLPIAQRCGWAFRDDVQYPERPHSQAADVGTEVHAAMERLINGDNLTATFEHPEAKLMYERASDWWARRPRSAPFAAEVAYAYNLDTRQARVLGLGIERKYVEYGAGPRDVCCSVDYMSIGTVGDIKTGWGAHVDPVLENLQLKFGGLCNALVRAASEGRPADSVTLEILRVRADGVHLETGTMSAFDLSLTESLVHEIVASIPRAEPVLGDHCSFCPALGACPKTRQGLEIIGPSTPARWTTEFLSLANDAAMAEALPALKKAVEAIDEALKSRYRGGAGLLLPNGKVWRETVSKREGLDTKKAAELLGDRISECLRVTEYTAFRQVKP